MLIMDRRDQVLRGKTKRQVKWRRQHENAMKRYVPVILSCLRMERCFLSHLILK